MDYKELFDSVIEYLGTVCGSDIQLKSGSAIPFPRTAYDMWIKTLKPHGYSGNSFTITASSEFHKNIMENSLGELLKDAFEHVCGIRPEIVVNVESVPDKKNDESDIRREELSNKTAAAEYEYTFDTFIVGKSNEFAHAACTAVAEKPGGAYNPLFIHGPSGLGKTHLMQAIANHIRENHPEMNIIYITGEVFTNELIEAIQRQNTIAFKKKYRSADILLVDDIQFISGKESTQEEFFHTFNELHSAGKQIVLTSDRPPKDIKTLEDRIRTRFEWGLIADIQTPDFETRVAIIKRKAELLDLDISDEVVAYIANRLNSNMRQLEGCVKKLKAYQHLVGTPPTLLQAQNTIREILSDEGTSAPVPTDTIISRCAAVYSVTPEDIRSSKRAAQISQARKVAAYIMSDLTHMSLQNIGAELGGKDHSTVSFYINDVRDSIKKDTLLKETIDDLKSNLSHHMADN